MLVLTRDPLADRLEGVVAVACTRTIRGLRSELRLGPEDGMPDDWVANFDTVHTIRRRSFRTRITTLGNQRLNEACAALSHALGCV